MELAAESGARFSGVLCGRATWQEGVPHFVRGGRTTLDAWLAAAGAANLRRINSCLKAAVSWETRA